MTGIAQGLFPHQARGSLIEKDGKVIGSALIGQNFTRPGYFHGRPSATTEPDPKDATKSVAAPYNAGNSSGSNAGPTAKSLLERVKGDVDKLKAEDPGTPVLRRSGHRLGQRPRPRHFAGGALFQGPRVAKARSDEAEEIGHLVQLHTEGAPVRPDRRAASQQRRCSSTWRSTLCRSDDILDIMVGASEQTRPSPDALLKAAQREGRGKFKIFFGAAPGVGKTYQMLVAAHRRKAEGVDVVVGVVEDSRPRRDRGAASPDSTSFPAARSTTRVKRARGDGPRRYILARRPRLVLVDELAHMQCRRKPASQALCRRAGPAGRRHRRPARDDERPARPRA